jgi:hypothetical protein
MDVLSAIETRFDFRLPAGFKHFATQGYLTYPGDAYLYVDDAEWIPLSELPSYDLCSYSPHLPGLVPFAFTGGGDHWCWKKDRLTKPQEYAVLFCPHDDPNGEWYAPTFGGWLYRRCLDYAKNLDDQFSPAEKVRREILRCASCLREIDESAWAENIEQIAGREPIEYELILRRTFKIVGYVTETEVASLVRDAFGPDYFEQFIQWMDWGPAVS